MRISDWSSDVCSSDLLALQKLVAAKRANRLPFLPTTLGAVTGEAVPAVRTAIRRIVINGMDVNDLPVSFADSQAFRALGLVERPALLLGMDSLSLFDRVEIDFPNKRVVFDLPEVVSRDMGRSEEHTSELQSLM